MDSSIPELQRSHKGLRLIYDAQRRMLRHFRRFGKSVRRRYPDEEAREISLEKARLGYDIASIALAGAEWKIRNYRFLMVKSFEEMNYALEAIQKGNLNLTLIVPSNRTRIARIVPQNQPWATEDAPLVPGVVNENEGDE